MEINNINLMDPVGNKGDITNQVNPSVLINAPCALSNLSLRETSCLSGTVSVDLKKTHGRGSLLETVRPQWAKVTESEQRIAWLKSMIGKKLVVRDLEAYARNICAK